MRWRPLPPDVDQAAYRIVRRRTNASRHAVGATASVEITHGRGSLTVRVDDDVAGSRRPPVPGFGLIGMRERVTALGGRLSASPAGLEGLGVRRAAGDRAVTKPRDPGRAGGRPAADPDGDPGQTDIVLMDVQMPEMDGTEAARQIVTDDLLADVRVVMLTNDGLDEYVFNALRAGASGFVVKDTEPADLLQARRVIVRGDALLSPGVTRRLINEFVARPADVLPAGDLDRLTNREQEVVALVAHGLSNDEIAERAWCSAR